MIRHFGRDGEREDEWKQRQKASKGENNSTESPKNEGNIYIVRKFKNVRLIIGSALAGIINILSPTSWHHYAYNEKGGVN